MKKSSIICVSSGLLLLAIGLTAMFILPLVIVDLIRGKMSLIAGNPSFELWRDLPIPISQKFYFYNVTNAKEVESGQQKPNLQEVGPFVYRMTIKKDNANLSQHLMSVQFQEVMSYYFVRNESVADESVVITTLNSPLAIAFGLIEPLPLKVKAAAYALINVLNESFFVQKSVRELLFDGYPDFLTSMAHILNPKIPLQTKFGWMYQKNISGDGLFTVNTGKSDVHKVNSIETFNGLSELTYWSGSRCNSFKGSTNGELFHPLDANEKLLFFRTQFCRTWDMIHNSSLHSNLGNLWIYRFYPALTNFANFSDYSLNSCFTPNSTLSETNDMEISDMIKNMLKTNGKLDLIELFDSEMKSVGAKVTSNANVNTRQFPSGVFDLSACQYGTPIYMSYAHFLHADDSFINNVSGLKPNASIHQTYLDVEPLTGSSVYFVARLQVNAFVNPSVVTPKYKNMPKIIFPVFWQQFTIEMTEQLAEHLKWSITIPKLTATIVSSIFVATGVILLIVFASVKLKRDQMHTVGVNNNASDDECSERLIGAQSDDSGCDVNYGSINSDNNKTS